jgi:hypothetical protein
MEKVQNLKRAPSTGPTRAGHLRTREEPSLETLWFKNKETMEKVQNLKSSNTAPSSKTFRDEKRKVCRYLT